MAGQKLLDVDDSGRRAVFGRLLSDALKAREMKQEDLAGMLGITQSSVSGWINGRYEPSAATVFSIEHRLGMDPGSLSRPLGYLPVEPTTRTISVEGAIAQNAQLDDEEKAVLASMYRLLVKRSTRSAGGDRPRSQPVSANRTRVVPGTANPVRPRTVAGPR